MASLAPNPINLQGLVASMVSLDVARLCLRQHPARSCLLGEPAARGPRVPARLVGGLAGPRIVSEIVDGRSHRGDALPGPNKKAARTKIKRPVAKKPSIGPCRAFSGGPWAGGGRTGRAGGTGGRRGFWSEAFLFWVGLHVPMGPSRALRPFEKTATKVSRWVRQAMGPRGSSSLAHALSYTFHGIGEVP